MTQFTIHDEHSAPEASQPVLASVRKNLGFIPNLYGVLAEAPVAAEAYGVLTDLVTRSSFTPVERHVVWFANIVDNDCSYCTAAHGTTGQTRSMRETRSASVRPRRGRSRTSSVRRIRSRSPNW